MQNFARFSLSFLVLLFSSGSLPAAEDPLCEFCHIGFSEHAPSDYRFAPNSLVTLPAVERGTGISGPVDLQVKVVGGTAVRGTHFIDDFPRIVGCAG